MPDSSPGIPPFYEIHNIPGMVVVSRPRRRYWLHALLLLGTIFTTLVVGARLQFNFNANLSPYTTDQDLLPFFWALAQPSRLLLGIPFSVTLLSILLAHEMGHFVACMRYRVNATLPFFIPAPTIIGTLGAFIRIKSPIPTRRALFDIGIAGPIAGFVIAVPVLALALMLSHPAPIGMEESQIQLNYPAIFHLMHRAFGSAVPLHDMMLHPIAMAAWVGMFATALNLLPGGQLDGGHIVFSIWPAAHRVTSRVLAALLICGVYFWPGWGVWAVLLMFSGMKHPRIGPAFPPIFADVHYEDPWRPIGAARLVIAAFGALMLLLTFMPVPYRVLN